MTLTKFKSFTVQVQLDYLKDIDGDFSHLLFVKSKVIMWCLCRLILLAKGV